MSFNYRRTYINVLRIYHITLILQSIIRGEIIDEY